MWNGHCEKTYSDGSIYIGKLKNGLRHGLGRFVSVDGSFYEGSWSDDVREG